MHALLPYLPIAIAVMILIRRTQRPRIIRPGRLWIAPVILFVLVGFYAFNAAQHGPRLSGGDWGVVAGLAAVGVVLGAVRAHSVKLQRHPDTGAIEARLSAWGLLIILVWMAGRILLRQSGLVNASAPFGLYTDGAMALALGVVLAQAVVLTRRCQAVMAEYPQSEGECV